ncbi:patatin-like phospholipase family protein [Kocuria rosea]|uniref:patatin-like phospholipase family protein n=1 Tax=Kocuria rosea TaxID=1275 RepID=UPI0025416141|nr:patatin-like phospholipase family protein [Kocuria rosea]WIG17322.1 patatin-like phospholipase family protein [Kocuria rosea]
MSPRTRVALALGSGGARGYAHIGVIEVLEERGYDIVTVAGSSMGALVGGLHAAGQLEAYAQWVRGLSQRDVLRLLDPSPSAPGVIRAEKIMAKVRELLAGRLIEDLPIPFTAVATDLLARKEVWFQEGPVDVAVRASIALPSIITPVMLNGRLLADGGIMNPVPIAATVATRADVTVAVSLSGGQQSGEGRVPAHETSAVRPSEEWAERFRRSASHVLDRELTRSVLERFAETRGRSTPSRFLRPAGSAPVDAAETILEDAVQDVGREALVDAAEETAEELAQDGFGALPAGLRTLDVMQLSLEVLQSMVLRYRLAGYPPDLLITVPKSAGRLLDFHRAGELIELGRRMTEEAIDRADEFPPARPRS